MKRLGHWTASTDVQDQRIILSHDADDEVSPPGGHHHILDRTTSLPVPVDLLEAVEDDPLVGSDETDFLGVAVTMLLHRFPFPIHQYGAHRMGCTIHQVLQNVLNRHVTSY